MPTSRSLTASLRTMSCFDQEYPDQARFLYYVSKGKSTDDSGSGNPGAALPKASVVLADDSLRMRSAIAEVLRSGCEVTIVGHALNGAQAMEAVDRLRPDILILDVIMPIMDGIRVTRTLRQSNSPTKIIILTAIADPSFQRAAMEAGAQAYVIKARMLTDLPQAIAALAKGETFRSSEQR